MSYETQDPEETEEGRGTPVVDSDQVQDEYDLADVVEADYYGTDDGESAEVTA
jgi:hypothetical protein